MTTALGRYRGGVVDLVQMLVHPLTHRVVAQHQPVGIVRVQTFDPDPGTADAAAGTGADVFSGDLLFPLGGVSVMDNGKGIEADLGLRTPNAARTADLDLLAYGRLVRPGGGIPPELPHPRMHLRPFVLLPLAEVAPGWRHPGSGRTVEALAASLPPEPRLRPL